MADNFNLRQFSTENKLTKNAQLLNESLSGLKDKYRGDIMDNKVGQKSLNATLEKDAEYNKLEPSEQKKLKTYLQGILNSEYNESKKPTTKETVKENKMTQRDKYLTRLVENALGLQVTEDDNVDYTMGRHDDPNQLPNPASQISIPEGDEMVNEKPMPKYENIEKLMQEIDKSTDEAAHKHKMEEMKRVADMLEKKCTALEEGEDSDHIDQKKLKQMKKDIMTLRKGMEKMEKLGEKKFTKKETKAELKEGFDLRKFLIENKLTAGSRMINELSPELLNRAAEKAKSQGRTLSANKFSNAANQQTYKAAAIEKSAKMEPMKPFEGKAFQPTAAQ